MGKFTKKLYSCFIALVLMVPLSTFAQRTQIQNTPTAISAIDLNDLEGKYFTGGSLNFGLSSSGMVDADDPSTTVTGFGVAAYVGKFATNNLAYGVNLGYNFESLKNNPGTDLETVSTDNILDIGLFGRVYSNPCGSMVNGYIEGGVELGFGNQTFTNSNGDEVKDNIGTFRAGLVPGIVIYPTDQIMLELRYGFLGYSSRAVTYEDPFTGDEVTDYNRWGGFDFDAKTITICFMYILPYPSWGDKMNGSFDGFGNF